MGPPTALSSSALNGFSGTLVGTAPVVPVASTTHDDSVRLGGKLDVIGDGFVCLSSLTHNTFVATQHTSVQRLGEDLQSAVKAAWPKQEGSRYSRVCVLLVSWVTDDLGVASEVQRLRHVFEGMYQFLVESYQIPDEKPDRALKGRILQFLANDQDDSLLVFYYAGHARRGPQSNERATLVSVSRAFPSSEARISSNLWHRNRRNPLITVPSSGIQTLLEEAGSDVLLLYDCCHSAAITTTGCFQGNKGVKEVIAACGYETIAPEVDKHSFTNALIETLASASKGLDFSVGELHSRVLSRLKCWTASLLYDENGKILETPEGNLAYERQPRRTPIYTILQESKPRRSIVLAPLTQVQQGAETVPKAAPSITPPIGNPLLFTDDKTVPSKKSKKRKRAAAKEPKWPQIVLSVRLDEAELEIPTWREWIRSLPAEAKDIKIEGMYKSFSTLLLIRMPVSVWNLMPDNGAYSFVGYVTSDNMAMRQDPEPLDIPEEMIVDEAQATQDSLIFQDSDSEISGMNTEADISKSRDITPLASEVDEVYSQSIESRPSSPSFYTTTPRPLLPAPITSMTQSLPMVTPSTKEDRTEALLQHSGSKPSVGSSVWHKARTDNHKEVERRRQETINEGINELAKIVPGGTKNKGSILERAVQYITQLKQNETENIGKYTLEKLLTEQAIAELSASHDKLRAECERAWREVEIWKKTYQSAAPKKDSASGSGEM